LRVVFRRLRRQVGPGRRDEGAEVCDVEEKAGLGRNPDPVTELGYVPRHAAEAGKVATALARADGRADGALTGASRERARPLVLHSRTRFQTESGDRSPIGDISILLRIWR